MQSALETETLFNVDGVQYKVLDESSAALWDASDVSGSYEISSQVTYDNATYSVTEIGKMAFAIMQSNKSNNADTVKKIQDGDLSGEDPTDSICKCILKVYST